jgi:hypothetical protein
MKAVCSTPLFIYRVLNFVLLENFTRFYIIANEPEYPLPLICGRESRQYALLQAHMDPLRDECEYKAFTIAEILNTLRLSISRIDRRPAIRPVQFQSTYLIELLGPTRSSRSDWEEEVRQGVKRVLEAGGCIKLIGLW